MTRALKSFALGALWILLAAIPSSGGHGGDWTVLTIPADHLQRLFEARHPVVPIDLSPAEEYRKGHLPGARSLPLKELLDRFQEIPKTGLVVLYCSCPPANPAGAYLILREKGYRNIRAMEEGFSEWVKRGYPVER